MNQPHLFCNVERCRVLFLDLFYLLCIHTLKVPLFVNLVFHFFADDSQLHKSSVPSDFPALACCLKDCIEDVAEWMGDSKLKMNDDKTELMAIGTRLKLSQVIPNLALVSISGCDISVSQSVRNLGFYLDEMLSMDAHTEYLCRILFCQLRRERTMLMWFYEIYLTANIVPCQDTFKLICFKLGIVLDTTILYSLSPVLSTLIKYSKSQGHRKGKTCAVTLL